MTKRSYEAHQTLEVFADAARAAGVPAEFVGYNEAWDSSRRRPPVALQNIVNPWRIATRIGQIVAGGRWVFLREFLAVPLLAGAPALWRYRNRLFLVCAHNVQKAWTRRRDRWALGLLDRMGFRFVLPETSAGLDRMGLERLAARALVLPFALTEAHLASPRGPKEGFVVGLVGRPRLDKGREITPEFVLSSLAEAGIEGSVLVGRPGAPPIRSDPRVEFVDTTSSEQYRSAVARSTAILIAYERSEYEYRPSATILDAAAAHTFVICSDFELFRTQVTTPTRIGVTFRTLEELPAALRATAGLIGADPDPFTPYLRHRSQDEIGRRIAEFVRRVEAAHDTRGPQGSRREP